MIDSNVKLRLRTAFLLIFLVLAVGVVAQFSSAGRIVLLGLAFISSAYAAGEIAIFSSKKDGFVPGCLRFFLTSGSLLICFFYLETLIWNHTPVDWKHFFALWGFAGSLNIGLIVLHTVMQSKYSLDDFSSGFQTLVIGFILCSIGGTALLALAVLPHGIRALLWLLLVVCINDSAAYFTGSRFGGPKMAELISPRKTISGSFGGFIGGILAGLAASPLLSMQMNVLSVVLLSIIIVAAAQLGDLLKSVLKRQHDVKDSGSLLPGHGGVLDRVDGILMAAPLMLFSLFIFIS